MLLTQFILNSSTSPKDMLTCLVDITHTVSNFLLFAALLIELLLALLLVGSLLIEGFL